MIRTRRVLRGRAPAAHAQHVAGDWVFGAEQRDTIPCVLCREVPPGGLPLRWLGDGQVFLCDDCMRKVEGAECFDDVLIDLVVDRSREVAEMFAQAKRTTDD